MTEEMFHAVVDKAGCTKGDGGRLELPDGSTMTLYLAHDGTQLQVSRVTALAQKGDIVETHNAKGETFLLALEDLFAASIVGGDAQDGGAGRKAGFLG
ncbi:MAG TPA: hypothetical protein ENK57_18150 [Polyangiaceae bacterium]|nr:hypothetical protein [Polyangiaceae bacterium]